MQKMIKLTLVFTLLLYSSGMLAQEVNKRFDLVFKNESMADVLKKIEKVSGVRILFAYEDVRPYHVTATLRQVTAEDAVKKVFEKTYLTYTVKENGKYISVVSNKTAMSEDGYVTGSVVDENGELLMGATITIESPTRHKTYTTTDLNGTFSCKAKEGSTIIASFVGYEKTTQKVHKGKSSYVLKLTPNVLNVGEVVVTGIFNKSKVSFTGAATSITKEQIKATGSRTLLTAIATIDPSFQMIEANDKGSNPNQKAYFQIRGTTSINPDINNLQNDISNERNMPLFILDGFEVESERVMDMNQADVESVVVLKDASATAIYGSRGANGVVVITSVKAGVGKLRTSYSVGLNLEIPDLSSYKSLNSLQKIQIEKEAGLYTGNTLQDQLRLDEIYNANLKAANEGVNTDWIHKPVQTGVGQYHKIDLSGGTDEFRYILNMSYNQIVGAMKGSSRNNLNGNMTISYLMKKVRLTNTLSLGFNNSKESPYGSFSLYTSMNPYWRPYDEYGSPIMGFKEMSSNYQTPNPLYDAAQTSFSKSGYTNIRNATQLDMDLMKNLRLNLNFGFSQQHAESDVFTSPKDSEYTIAFTGYDASQRGEYIKGYRKLESFQFGGTVSWAKVLGDHMLYAGLNTQVIESNTNSTNFTVRGFMNDQMNDISNANSYSQERPASTEKKVRSIGFTSTFNYNYASRYFFDMSYRLDGGSSFGSQSRWAPFYSVGAGWDIAREPFVASHLSTLINQFKLRYSFGITGSLATNPYDALTTYKYDTKQQYNDFVGAVIYTYGNPRLKWQDTKQHNVGGDLSLIDNRMGFSFNYYRKTTNNLISEVGLPISHGYPSYKENLGIIRNIGYDLTASYTILRQNEKGIQWSVRAGMSHNKNTIVKLSESVKRQMEQYENQSFSGGSLYQYREGHSTNDLWVAESIGVDPESGKRLYVDKDGTITTNGGSARKVSAGSILPKIDTRFGTGFRWKGFFLDLNFTYRYGAKKLNTTLMNKIENAQLMLNVDPRVIDLRWKKPGDVVPFKDIRIAEASVPNTAFVFTEKLLTLNSVYLTYECPKKWIEGFKMERLAFTASMTDLLYISNIEQERGVGYPYTIKPTFSLSCTF